MMLQKNLPKSKCSVNNPRLRGGGLEVLDFQARLTSLSPWRTTFIGNIQAPWDVTPSLMLCGHWLTVLRVGTVLMTKQTPLNTGEGVQPAGKPAEQNGPQVPL